MEPETNKTKILLVDDDQFLITLYQKKAEGMDIELHTATSGQEALDMLTGGLVPDVMAFDITMAGMTGTELLQMIDEKRIAPTAKKVILSNTTDEAVVAEAKAAGASSFIVKASLLPSQVLDELIKVARE